MAKKYKPFSTRDYFSEWCSKNCGTCKKGFDKKGGRFRCEWERKLCAASIYGDTVSEEVARAIGYLDSEGCDLWQCSGWERGRKGVS